MVPRWKARIRDIVIVVVSVGLSLATVELLLYVVDTPPQFDKYTVALRELRSDAPARWSTLDPDVGVKFDDTFVSQDELDRLSSRPRNFSRLKIINTDGYHDFDEFNASIAKLFKHRFLFLGDSFTWGASADIGQSFVEIFEKQVNDKLRDGLVWNTGVPGTGTRQHYKVLERFGARMQPDHVVLGFYENDVLDNVFGMDRYFVTRAGISISKYKLDHVTGEPYKLSRKEMIARLKWLVRKQESGFWNAFRTTRLIKQAFAEFLKGRAVVGDPSLPKKATTLTMDYLKSIKALCDEYEWQLTILIIPSRQTVARSGNSHVHHSMLRLSAKLDADVIDPTSILSLGDYARAPDGHWNNEGHRKVGILLADHLLPRKKADAAG